MDQAGKDQFEHDKKQALDEGYSEDQAIQYAQQEQQLRISEEEKKNKKA